MKRPLHIWLVFAACLLGAFAALAWASVVALRLDRSDAEARRQAAFEEKVRLALWRMDSRLAPVIARENSRPSYEYDSFYQAGDAYTRSLTPTKPGDVVMPSPVFAGDSQYVLLHFQLGPDGALTSPEAPAGDMRIAAEGKLSPRSRIDAAAKLLGEVSGFARRDELAALVPPVEEKPLAQVAEVPQEALAANAADRSSQIWMNAGEFQARQQAVSGQNTIANQSRALRRIVAYARRGAEGPMAPLWVGERLVLARAMSLGGREYIQGCWLDWPALERQLLGDVADLFPNARLEPVRPDTPDAPGRMLASIPARFDVEPEGAPADEPLTPLRLSLLVVWGALLLSAGALGALLWGAVTLGERRGAFVSAVTHELRTPLTTFRIYTEMLAENMVADEAARAEYLATLRREAERLSHLVENVLAYSRLERTRPHGVVEALSVKSLLDRMMPRLAGRAREAGMEIVVDDAGALDLAVTVDASAAEQVLFNLVDNAAKYASSASDRRIHVSAARSRSFAAVTVRDHGPGVSRRDARKLFRPFSKSARDAAGSAPGVGLGLALSRSLARRLGGDLRLEKGAGEGAAFTLTLPLAE